MRNDIKNVLTGVGIGTVISGLVLFMAASPPNRSPLYGSFLQNNMDGNTNSITNLLNLTISGVTNQVTFGGTNPTPNSTNLVLWISVNLPGDTNSYRLGLAK